MLSDTLRGKGADGPLGRRVLAVDNPDGGGGGARPRGAGTGGLPTPTTVVGRLGVSAELVLGRRGMSTDIVDVGRSARQNVSHCTTKSFKIPPVFIPPFVDLSLGIPPANIPPRPGAAPKGGRGAGLGASAFPALFALALVLGSGGGLNPAFGTGGAPPIDAAPVVVGFPYRQLQQ